MKVDNQFLILNPVDLVTFTEDIRNGKLHFLSSVYLWIK